MSKKILLADDSITIQKVIELTFSDEDFDVITVGNGRLALEKLPEVRPDIVLCDIIMPEKDGYQVCEQIKASPATAHVPVLLLTGAFEPFDQERAARAGYDGSLAKPFEPETLIAKVKDLLARAPARAVAPPPAPVVRPAARPPAARPPAAAAPPPVLPFPRPAPPPTPPPKASFIPDEPFGHLEEPEAAGAAGPTLAPITEDESATLLSPPAPEPAPGDSTSTVMFHAGDLPWSTPPPPAPTPAHAPAAPAPPSTAAPEPVFLPEDSAEVVEEPAVFEEVLEEDLDFGETSLEPPGADTRTVLFTPGVTLPPILPAEGGGLTGAFEAVKGGAVHEPQAAPAFEPEPVYEPEPEPFYEPEPMPAFEPESVIAEATAAAAEPERLLEEEASPGPGPAPLAEPEPSPAFEPQPFEPEPAPPAAAPESFADVAPAAPSPEPSPVAASEAAHVAVPVEMVEKIAQRVVAQISEKAVREIAWEVIPDLAEALIKREIERLKAELQKT